MAVPEQSSCAVVRTGAERDGEKRSAPVVQHDPDWFLLDLVGRLLFAHRLDPTLAMDALGITTAAAEGLVERSVLPALLGYERRERLERFANLLVRLELRLGDSAEIRRALHLPLPALGNRSPAETLAGPIEDLRRLRAVVDTIAVEPTKWWRVGH